MKKVFRRLRGLIGTGITWSVGFVVSMGVAWGFIAPFQFFWEAVPMLSLIGFLMGSTFGGILALTERTTRLEDLSLWRVGLWGAIGSVLAVAGVSVVMALTFKKMVVEIELIVVKRSP